MRKIVAGLAITLDGVVEAPSQGKWLRFSNQMGELISASLAESDAILLGRRGYLEFAQLWPKQGSEVPMADFMNNTHKYVVSSTLSSLDWANSSLITGDLVEQVGKLKEQPGKNIQLPGSPSLVRSLLVAGLLDELALMIHPIVLGSGRRLFEEVTDRLELQLAESQALDNGVLYATYRRVANS